MLYPLSYGRMACGKSLVYRDWLLGKKKPAIPQQEQRAIRRNRLGGAKPGDVSSSTTHRPWTAQKNFRVMLNPMYQWSLL